MMHSTTLEHEPSCTCGQHVNEEDLLQTHPRNQQIKQNEYTQQDSYRQQQQPPNQHATSLSSHHAERLDSSFVHLPEPLSTGDNFEGSPSMTGMDSNDKDGLYNHGFGRANDHIDTLLGAMEDFKGEWKCDDGCGETKYLCRACIQRMANALDEETERLELECQAYIDAVKNELYKQTRLEKALSINLGVTTTTTNNNNNNEEEEGEEGENPTTPTDLSNEPPVETNDLVSSTVHAFQQEMETLTASCASCSSELERLDNLLLQQSQLSQSLTAEEESILSDLNALEIDVRSFENTHHRLTLQCHKAELEVAALSQVRLHSSLFDISVDGSVPLINGLRFSHRPERGVGLGWGEINAAWSQAAQMVMFVASSVRFRSRGYRIVLLTTCAKIIEVGESGEKRIVHNLGFETGDSSGKARKSGQDHIVVSVRAFHALLQEMFAHLKSIAVPPSSGIMMEKPPFEIGKSFIGSYDFRQIRETDDVGWRSVIHCLASNMRWLTYNVTYFAK